MKYDDATWHSGGQGFPSSSPPEFGGTHIALFLRWCFIQGWAGALHLQEEPEDVARVQSGAMSATDFLFKYCDGKFTDEDLNEEGNRFAGAYYVSDYLEDYSGVAGKMVYSRPERDHDFAKISALLQNRLKAQKAETSDDQPTVPKATKSQGTSIDPGLIVQIILIAIVVLGFIAYLGK